VLRALVPAGAPSAFGALFAPPDAAESTTGWPPGVVIFRYVETGGAQPAAATWFGIEIVRTNASGKEPPPEPTSLP
jgi:hypothetical protein